MNDAVVTGIGLVTPLGLGRESTWHAMLAGKSAVRKDGALPDLWTARIENLPLPAETRLLSMAFLAAAEAVQDSGLDLSSIDMERFGCSVSVSKPNLAAQDLFFESFLPSTVNQQLCRVFKLKGPTRNIAAACATGAGSVMIAADWIRHGHCDIALAGAAESSLHPLYLAAFKQMGVLCKELPKPFDLRRDGFAMGEGAAILLLERKDAAVMRGARVYGTIAGFALTNDTRHPVAFTDTGTPIATAIQKAMEAGKCVEIDYVHAHGTGTPLNDIIETRALRKAFGPATSRFTVSSTKAATGHLLGASGALGIGVSLLAIRDQVAPPTLNLSTPDIECDLDYIPWVMRPQKIDASLSLSFGFGGQIGAVVVTK